MATRATYGFPDRGITVYIHHDGYPEGAAAYFTECILKDNKVTPEGLIRHCEGIITDSHDQHGDTEYRYNILDNDTVEIIKRDWSDKVDQWRDSRTFSLSVFLVKYGDFQHLMPRPA